MKSNDYMHYSQKLEFTQSKAGYRYLSLFYKVIFNNFKKKKKVIFFKINNNNNKLCIPNFRNFTINPTEIISQQFPISHK